MAILVNEVRLSLIWGKAFDANSLLPVLATKTRYAKEFNAAADNTGEWQLPWPRDERNHHFWQYYLSVDVEQGGGLDAIGAESAWQYLLPLRSAPLARVATPDGLRITFEGYGYPHSVAVIATLAIRQPLPLYDMVDKVVTARHDTYAMTWLDDDQTVRGTLDGLAIEIIDRLHQTVLSGHAPRGKPLGPPFTVATVIDATHIDLAEAPGDDLRLALDGLCTLQPAWKEKVVRDPEESQVIFKEQDQAPASHVMQQFDRGRAIWFPSYFTEATGLNIKIRKLGCYHRNLTLASMQARSLIAVIRRAAGFVDQRQPIASILNKPARSAAKLLELLHDGDNKSYQSNSLRIQIEPNLDDINKVRKVFGQQIIEPAGS